MAEAKSKEKWLTAEEHSKLVEDEISRALEKIPKSSDADEIKYKLTAYKGLFTKAQKQADLQLSIATETDSEDYSEDLRNSLWSANDKLDIYKGILEYIFELFLIHCSQDQVKKTEEDSKAYSDRYYEISKQLQLAILRTEGQIRRRQEEHQLQLAELQKRPATQNEQRHHQGLQDRNVPRIASTLQPELLQTESFDPVKLNSWVEKCGEYLRANQVPQMTPNKQQISYARTLVEEQLYNLIEPKITNETVAVAFDEDENVRKEVNNENPSFIELLILEWLRLYPLAQRRLELFQLRQPTEVSSTAWLSQLEKKFDAADVRKIRPELIEIYIAMSSLNNTELQKECLKDFQDNKINDMADLKKLAQNEEISSRTANFMTGKTVDKVYLTEYKKQQRKSFQQNKGQKGQKGQEHKRDQSKHKKDGKWCNLHKTKSHSNEECHHQKGQKGQQDRGRSRYRRSPSPYRGRSKSSEKSRSQSPYYPRSDRPGDYEKASLVKNICNLTNGASNLPIMAFDFEIRNGRRTKKFIVPAYPDTASSRSIMGLKTAEEIGLEFKPAPGETLYNASNEEMKINGKAKLQVGINGGKTVLIDALISQDLDSKDDNVNLIGWHDLEALGIINISKYRTKIKHIKKQSEKAFAVKNKSFQYDPKTYEKEFPALPAVETEKNKTEKRHSTIAVKNSDLVDVEKMSYNEITDLLIQEFSDIITDKMPEKPMNCKPYVIQLNEEKVKAFPPRPALGIKAWPLHKEEACRRVLTTMEENGIIRKLGSEESTPYLGTSMFIDKKDKNADPRLVVNHDRLNLNQDRLVHPINSPSSLIQRISPDSEHWFKGDFLAGYHQIGLAKQSQPLTAFLTPIGRFCFQRLSMGNAIASDVFNIETDLAFEPLMSKGFGLLKCVDDVAFSAKTKSELYKKKV